MHALGLCSGGYNAFKAAVAGVPLDGVLLITPLTFFYKPDHAPGEAEDKVIFEASRYLRRLRDVDAPGRSCSAAASTCAPPSARWRASAPIALRGRLQELARARGLAVGDDLARELTQVTGKRIPLRFVFSGGDPGIGLLRMHGGPTVEKLRLLGQLSIEIIEGADHTFTPLWSHAVLTSTLAAHFDDLPRTPMTQG